MPSAAVAIWLAAREIERARTNARAAPMPHAISSRMMARVRLDDSVELIVAFAWSAWAIFSSYRLLKSSMIVVNAGAAAALFRAYAPRASPALDSFRTFVRAALYFARPVSTEV
jgi:hypothetical protein